LKIENLQLSGKKLLFLSRLLFSTHVDAGPFLPLLCGRHVGRVMRPVPLFVCLSVCQFCNSQKYKSTNLGVNLKQELPTSNIQDYRSPNIRNLTIIAALSWSAFSEILATHSMRQEKNVSL